jgi:nitroimidazol reductase NimA-like FMN-containing flavoprotein (pyridoxamine 5'-phosphate oxidase superfamily)
MHETPDDLRALQALLDQSAAEGGRHLTDVITPDRRLSAAELSARLRDMCLLTVATVSSDGRPFTGPVDGFFHRGQWYFSSATYSLKFRHIVRNPAVSATHLPGEHLAVTVHGTAVPIDIDAPEHADFKQVLRDYYLPRYGSEWEAMQDADDVVAYARIDARRMFTFSMDPS